MVFLSGMHRSATDTSGLLPQILLMIAASLSFALMGVFVRLASGTHVIWKVFFRNLVVLLVILITVPPRRWPMLIGTRAAGVCLLRGFCSRDPVPALANASLLPAERGGVRQRQELDPDKISELPDILSGSSSCRWRTHRC
jgi:hypothetical protein